MCWWTCWERKSRFHRRRRRSSFSRFPFWEENPYTPHVFVKSAQVVCFAWVVGVRDFGTVEVIEKKGVAGVREWGFEGFRTKKVTSWGRIA